MSNPIRETERLLEDRFERKRAFLVGRGATGLLLLYEALTPRGGRIILPAIACPSLLATALISGRQPVIVDVDRNLNIDILRADYHMREGDMVVGVHIFGIPCGITELEKRCAEKGAILIEDAAQAIGGKIDGRMLGAFVNASLLSFASGKILPTNGGGAILTDDDTLIEKLKEAVAELPERPDDLAVRAKSLRDELTRALNEARRDNPDAASEWESLYNRYGSIYRYSIDPREAADIKRTIDDLENIAESRCSKLKWYHSRLDGLPFETLYYPDDCCPYRFSFIAPAAAGSDVQHFTELLRDAGLHASNLYVPLHWLAPGKVENTGCARADYVGPRIINLWLDEQIDESHVEKAAEIMSKMQS